MRLPSDHVSALAAVRAEIASLKSQRSDVEIAPVPPEEAITALDAALKHHANDGADQLNVHDLVGNRPQVLIFGRPTDNLVLALKPMFAIFSDRIRAAYVAEIERFYKANKAGLPANQRREKLAELDRRILQLEIREEMIFTEMEASGLTSNHPEKSRRPDADPRAVLHLVDSD